MRGFRGTFRRFQGVRQFAAEAFRWLAGAAKREVTEAERLAQEEAATRELEVRLEALRTGASKRSKWRRRVSRQAAEIRRRSRVAYRRAQSKGTTRDLTSKDGWAGCKSPGLLTGAAHSFRWRAGGMRETFGQFEGRR